MADQEESVAVIKSPVEGEAGGSKLERLPAELIQPIFDFLHHPGRAHQTDLIRPLSKHLLPYSTAALYRRIKITTFDDLCQLCATTSHKATLGPLIQALEFYGDEGDAPVDVNFLALISRLVEGLLCTSLINLKTLEVRDWSLVGKVVLSERFGREGGRALETIKLEDCFGSIEGSIITAWSHLRHLPVLSSIAYQNWDPLLRAEAAIPPKLGGFEKLTKLECSLRDFSSIHATNFASLLSPIIQQIELIHLHMRIRPNFSPFLDFLSPDLVSSITLSTKSHMELTSLDQFPLHQSLTRFPRLQHLEFYDERIFDAELIDAILGLNLVSLEIHRKCKLSYDLIHQLLSGIKRDSSWKTVEIRFNAEPGYTCRTYRAGTLAVLQNGTLIPGHGWQRPDWSTITLPEARELMRISIEKGIELDGDITRGLAVEREFEEEEKWLEMVMKFMRTGPVDCTDCGKKN